MKVIYHTNLERAEGAGLIYSHIRQALEDAGMLHKYKYFPIQNPVEFDSKAVKEIKKCDLFISGIGGSLFQVRKAKKLGAKTLLLRFSTHHLYQQRKLQGIYARYGMKQFGTDLYRTLREYDQSDYFLVLSNLCKHTYILNGISPEKVFVVHSGVDAELFGYGASRSRNFKLLFVGTNPIRKGLPLLLKAWKELNIKGELINRSGTAFPPQKGVVNKGDFLTQKELAKVYQSCSVTILPSLEEGFAGSNLESMACGRPIITTNVTGIEDVMTNYKEGILIPPNNIKAIKEAILYFYENQEELIRMGINARKKAEEYPWSKFRKGIVGVVKKILE